MKNQKAKKNRALQIVREYFPGVTQVEDATKPTIITVTPKDSEGAEVQSHTTCAYAVACKRQMRADGVIIAVKTAYIIYGKRAVRYRMNESVSREIVSFDRKAGFATGSYQLRAPSDCERLGADYAGKTRNPSNRKAKPFRHLTSNIRTHLGWGALLLLSVVASQAYTMVNPDLKTTWGPGKVEYYVDLGKFDSVALSSLADWSQYTGRTKLIGIDSTNGGTFFDNRNEIRWGARTMPSNVLAWTYLNYSWDTGRMIESDIEFNPLFGWNSYGGGGGAGYDVGRVALHEIGHSIGLGHSPGPNIMNPYYSGIWELSEDDIAGAKFLYNPKSVPETGPTLSLLSLAVIGLVILRLRGLTK